MKKSLLGIGVLAAAMLLAGCGTPTTSSAAKSSTTASTTTTSSAPAATSEAASTSVAKVNKFRTYTAAQWIAEDFSAKKVSYQFTSSEPFEIKDYGIGYHVCINLYEDGSILADARNIYSCYSWMYYGAWDAAKDEDGYNQLNVAELFENNGQDGKGTDAVACKKTAVLNESSTGTFAWTFAINMAPGQYARDINTVGSATAKYADFDAFHTAVDIISVKTEFMGTTTSGTVRVLGLSNGVANAYFYVVYGGKTIRAGKWEGGKYANNGVSESSMSGTDYTFDFTGITNCDAKFTSTIAADGTAADFEFKGGVAGMTGSVTTITCTVSKVATVDVNIDGTIPTPTSSAA